MIPENLKKSFIDFHKSMISNDVIDPKTTFMIEMGAAMAVGCYPCMEKLTLAAKDKGVSDEELGTIQARHIPQVILTSNVSRELSDALRRRCLYLYLDFPSRDQEEKIIQRKVPNLDEKLIRQVADTLQAIRRLDLKKLPSIGEALDWARSLLLLNADKLSHEIVQASLPTLIKSPGDQERVMNKLGSILAALPDGDTT